MLHDLSDDGLTTPVVGNWGERKYRLLQNNRERYLSEDDSSVARFTIYLGGGMTGTKRKKRGSGCDTRHLAFAKMPAFTVYR